MERTVLIGGVPTQVGGPSDIMREGSEAVVYLQPGKPPTVPGRAVRLLRKPTDPFYLTPEEGDGARGRLAELPARLQRYPKGLPINVIGPIDPITEKKNGPIIGHTMALVPNAETLEDWCDIGTRETSGVSYNDVVGLLKHCYLTEAALHTNGVVIGDRNLRNILVSGGLPYYIDALGFGYGGLESIMFTADYIAPELCVKGPSDLEPVRMVGRHTPQSDDFGFWVMFFRVLLGYHPFDGRHKPVSGTPVERPYRMLERISVLRKDVGLVPGFDSWDILPDELIRALKGWYEEGNRDFSASQALLDSLKFTKCKKCSKEFACEKCPACIARAVVLSLPKKIKVSVLFEKRGLLIRVGATGETDKDVTYVYHDGKGYRREDDREILAGPLSPRLKWRLLGRNTVLGADGVTTLFSDSGRTTVDTDLGPDGLPAFDTNNDLLVWVKDGEVLAESVASLTAKGAGNRKGSPKKLATGLSNNTQITVGSTFGMGYFRSGRFDRWFVFELDREKETVVQLPRVVGTVVSHEVLLGADTAWLFLAATRHGVTTRHCFAIARNGKVLGHFECRLGDTSWLGYGAGHIGSGRTPCAETINNAVVPFLLVMTEEGVRRIDIRDSTMKVTKTWAGTESIVSGPPSLRFLQSGLVVHDRRLVVMVKG